MTTTLHIDDVEARLAGHTVISGATILVAPGELAVLVGPNGSGKSTLLRAVYRSLRPSAGVVLLDEDDIWRLPARRSAQRVSALTQERPSEAELTVKDVVALGRLPYQRAFASLGSIDLEAIDEAIAQANVGTLVKRRFSELSGGERQRVLMARVLAQRTSLIVLDEPTNHLDVQHQFDLLEPMRASRATVLTAMHDLNLAAAYGDRVHVINRGTVRASGTPAEVLTPELVAEVFSVTATPTVHPVTKRPQLHLSPLHGRESADS